MGVQITIKISAHQIIYKQAIVYCWGRSNYLFNKHHLEEINAFGNQIYVNRNNETCGSNPAKKPAAT
jgi:hypothetical protein